MKPFAVVLINTAYLSRIVYETASPPRAVGEATYHTYLPFVSSAHVHNVDVSLKNPLSVFFADTEEAAKLLATNLAQWNPGTSWQWFRSAGMASSRNLAIPIENINVKAITEKGMLP
jgi:hypothetical protein